MTGTRRSSNKSQRKKSRDHLFSLSLLENAKDFMDETVRCVKSGESREWKYAILHLTSALELVLKSILEREHWSLIFQNVDMATKEALGTGQFKSVDFDTAITRIRNIVRAGVSERDYKQLMGLRQLRNRITHLHCDFNVYQAKGMAAKGILIFLRFYKMPALGKDFDATYEFRLVEELRSFEKFVDARIKELGPALKGAERPSPLFRDCPDCVQDALVTDESGIKCLFCGSEFSAEDLALQSDGPGGPCPDCEDGSLAFILHGNDDGEFVCVLCGFSTEYSHNKECAECGATFWDDSEEGWIMCPSCTNYKMNKD